MEEGRRSGDPSGYLVKNRSSSGCLIVRKKGNDGVAGVGCSGSRKLFGSKKERKRARMDLSDSESSEELLMPPRRRVAPETIRVCNGLGLFERGAVEGNDIGRSRSRGENVRNNEVDVTGRNGEDFNERKRNRLDVFEFDEYDGSDVEMRRRNHFDDGEMVGRRLFGSMTAGRGGLERDYETGSGRHLLADRRSSYFERISGLNRGDHGDRERNLPPVPFYRDKYGSNEPIRVQGKNGVLKVMVNKKKKLCASWNIYDGLEVEEKRKGVETEGTVKRNVLLGHSFYPESKSAEKASPFANKLKNPMKKLKSSSAKSLSMRNSKIRDQDSEDSGTSLKLGPKSGEAHNTMKTPLSTKSLKGEEVDSDDSDTSLKLEPKNAEARKLMKGASSGGELTPRKDLPPAKTKEGKVKRGTGTEKQKLRERIRGMLLNSGWTIDYRPRRNRDYLDAVYINPNGTAYWSIIKAYDALLKQLNDEEEEARAKGDASFMPLSDEVLSQLTRKTRKKMEKEMKRKQREGNESENAREAVARRSSSSRHDEESMDSGSNEEKLSSFIKQGSKSVKSRNGSSSLDSNTKGQGCSHHPNVDLKKMAFGFHSHQGRKSRKLGRCTLLVRNSYEGPNSDSDGFVPYSGKRTVLSWLIDCGTVQLSQKVRYMNRRRTRIMLEGWLTRDGIHCGCCSKILTVSKFEIHAGSKLRQPFQNIYLDSGISLLECQIDAWNRQESVEHIGFHSVDVDGDDPNDDTCGLCGDGGDLICCDSCPSTFHQSCLDIEMLPPGDWHCPNCTCKFCGIASEQDDYTTVCELLTCTLCAKKYHKSCSQETDTLSTDTNSLLPCFCGNGCREIFEQLQKYLGVKHELEAGFSWCLIRRTDVGLDTSPLGVTQRVENNSKLAVALSVMDECFLPIVDRRSGINIIHNVLFNSGSNFNRLNYSGFYAAILERGDEIISAASIRFHGTQLAEMPFIGTRHIYRRQGMFRRLFCAIESALCSLKVQKLIIPAISELTHTWTGVFGFTTHDGSLKQELKHMNMLVFPGLDMLQKQLSKQENIGGNRTTATGTKGMEFEDSQCNTPEAVLRSAEQDVNERDNGVSEDTSGSNDEVPTRNSDSQSRDGPLSKTPVSSSLDSPNEHKDSLPSEEMGNTDFDSGVKLNESASENKRVFISGSSHDLHKVDIKAESESPVENKVDVLPVASESLLGVPLNDTSVMKFDGSSEQENAVSLHRTVCPYVESGDNAAQSTSESNGLIVSDLNGDMQEENQPEAASPVKNNIQSCKDGNFENVHSLNLNESASDEPKMPKSIEDTNSVKLAFNGKCQFDSDTDNGPLEIESGPLGEPASEDKFQSGEDVHVHARNADNTANGTDNSCKQINCDQNDEMAFERKAN